MKQILTTFLCLLAVGLLMSRCQSTSTRDAGSGGSYSKVSAAAFDSLCSLPEMQVLDVRTPAEYTLFHLPGSINVNALEDDFAQMADSVLDKSRPVAVYCRSGRRSEKAGRLLMQGGYVVYDLQGGVLHRLPKATEVNE